jgi:type II secretory pathway pseudopilin PulG
LLELLVVIAIIGILMTILIPAIQGMMQRSRQREAEATASAFANAIRNFRADYGYWPTAENSPSASSLSPDNYILVRDYLLGNGTFNTKARGYWDVNAVVSNTATRKPFVITINVINDKVIVQ